MTYDDPEARYTYRSPLVDHLRSQGALQVGRLKLVMPSSFGFCWGVDRALAMVGDAREKHGDQSMWLLNSIIHNPRVNADMEERGIGFLKGERAKPGVLEDLGEDDVVIVPAFSAMVEEMEDLREKGVTIVDTTCPWVIKPHKRAQKYVREGFTTVVHATVGHDETRSTCSLIRSEGGQFVIVHDLLETEILASYLEGKISEKELKAGLHTDAVRSSFDSQIHLQKIGVINQTTMLASESRQVADRLRAALVEAGGEECLVERFRDFDTICNATQENQDAAQAVVDANPDLFLVVGGFDSSNTRNLARVGDDAQVPSIHIHGPDCFLENGDLLHRERATGESQVTSDWLPDGEVTIAFTGGASTPDTILGQVVANVLHAAGEELPAELAVQASP